VPGIGLRIVEKFKFGLVEHFKLTATFCGAGIPLQSL